MPDHLTGVSLRALARGETPGSWRDHVLVECEVGRGIRTADHAYASYNNGANAEQLYDLVADPGQTRNFAGDPEKADELARHRDLLGRHPDNVQ